MIYRTQEPETTTRRTATDAPRRESTVDLLKDLRDDATRLVRAEIALAKEEAREQVRSAGRGAGSVAAGGLVAFAGFLFVLGGASWLLAFALEAAGVAAATSVWLAPLILGAVVALVGFGMVRMGLDRIRSLGSPPRETADSLREDRDWLKEKVKR